MTIEELKQKKAGLVAQFDGLKAKIEADNKRQPTEDEAKQFSAIESQLTEIAEEIKKTAAESFSKADKGLEIEDKMDVKVEFNKYLKGQEFASNAVITTTGSGAYVPKEVMPVQTAASLQNAVRAAMAYFGISAYPISGRTVVTVPVLVLGDGGDLTGNEDSNADNSSSDASLTITPAVSQSKPQWMDKGIVTAQNYDVASAVLPIAKGACDRREETRFFTGNITTAALKTAAQETVTASTVDYTDLNTLIFSLGAYSIVGRKALFVSSSLLALMNGMLDGNDRPIDKLTKVGEQYFWDGVPVFPTAQLEAVADGKYVAAIVNLDACAITSDGAQVEIYDGESGHPNQVGYNWLQTSGMGIKSDAVKLLKVKAAG